MRCWTASTSEAQASRFLPLLAQLPIDVDDRPSDIAALAALGRHHDLSAYGASYLALARRPDAGLASVDADGHLFDDQLDELADA